MQMAFIRTSSNWQPSASSWTFIVGSRQNEKRTTDWEKAFTPKALSQQHRVQETFDDFKGALIKLATKLGRQLPPPPVTGNDLLVEMVGKQTLDDGTPSEDNKDRGGVKSDKPSLSDAKTFTISFGPYWILPLHLSSDRRIEMYYGSVELIVISKTSLVAGNHAMTQKAMSISIIPQLWTGNFHSLARLRTKRKLKTC
jgi:hypothetical protein